MNHYPRRRKKKREIQLVPIARMNYWPDQTAFHLPIKYVQAFIFNIWVVSKSRPTYIKKRKKRKASLSHFAPRKARVPQPGQNKRVSARRRRRRGRAEGEGRTP